MGVMAMFGKLRVPKVKLLNSNDVISAVNLKSAKIVNVLKNLDSYGLASSTYRFDHPLNCW